MTDHHYPTPDTPRDRLTYLDSLPYAQSVAIRLPGSYMDQSAKLRLRLEDPAFRSARIELVATLSAHVLGRELAPLTAEHTVEVTADVPADWWQHWKFDHQTRWWMRPFMRRWPPRLAGITRYVTLHGDVSRAALFPEANYLPRTDHLGAPVLVWQPPEWSATATATRR